MLLGNFIITVCCLVDIILKNLPGSQKFRYKGFEPKLSDSEVITMELVAEFLGIDTDKGTWEYFAQHWLSWFPALDSLADYAKHASNLKTLMERVSSEIKILVARIELLS